MIGKLLGAFAGDRLAKQTGTIGGASGAALGVLATTILRRVSLPAMVALGVGGYAVKKYLDKQDRQSPDDASPSAQPPKTSTAPASA